jgi:hypothetical protein
MMTGVLRFQKRALSENLALTQSATLETTQGQIDGFFCKLPYKCHQNQVKFQGD